MPRGIGYNYFSSLSSEEKDSLLGRIYKLYIIDNLSMKDVSECLDLDFNIIRYAIRNNIGGNLKKSKSKKYELIFDHVNSTNDKRYGGHPMKNEKVKSNLRNSFYSKYGVYHNKQIGKSTSDINNIYDKERFESIILSIDEDDRTIDNLVSIMNYSRTPILAAIRKFDLSHLIKWSSTDYPESQIKSFLERNIDGISIISHYHGWSKEHSSKYEIDLYCKNYNVGIEFNGIYYHQIKYKGSMYHQEKSLDAINNGIFVYHIWENEWYNPNKRRIIESQLLNLLRKTPNRIYARDCSIKMITPDQSRIFLDSNHLQGSRGAKYHIGLFYKDELVSVMTFGDNYFIRKNHDIELLRFATKLNTIVLGGASKLFKYFIRNYNPDKIISYCNIDTGNGRVYRNLGFRLVSITPPNYFWVDRRTGETISRYKAQNMNETSMSNDDNYFKLSNSGNYKFEWRRDFESN